MDLKKALPLLDKYFSWATPKRVLMLALTAIVCIVSLTLFEHRSAVSDIFLKTKDPTYTANLSLSTETKKHIEDLVTRLEDVNMVLVVAANIRVNQREVIYYYSDDRAVDGIIKNVANSRTVVQPIFSNDEKTNAEMVSVINGEFGCYKNDENSGTIIGPRINAYVPAVCRVSLPPYYGEFSGYITIGLTHLPDPALQNLIRTEAIRLATEIYYKTIKGH